MNYPISGNVSLGNVSGNIKLYINDSGSSNLTGIGYNNNSLTFGVNQSVTANPEMVINPSGNVGIGTTNPAYPLDITGNIRIGVGTTGNIRFGNSGIGTTQAGYIDLINNNMTIMNQQLGNLILGTNNSEDMRILTNGLVGIGTVNPQGTLHIASSGLNSTTVMIKDISNNNLLRLVGNLSTGGYNNITQNNDVGIFYGDSNNPNPRSLVIAPYATGQSGIRMDTNGNVGIGTSNPTSTLHVNGNISSNNLILNSTTFRYIPWTVIATRTGSTGSALSVCIAPSTGTDVPLASTNASCRLRYLYSVIGNTMYLSFLYQHTVAATQAGTFYYKYRLPSGFTLNSNLVSAPTDVASSTAQNGSRLGEGILHVAEVHLNTISVLYLNLDGDFIVLLREQVLYGYQSSSNFSYGASNVHYTFDASIPLA
jgi:hypothetical protein